MMNLLHVSCSPFYFPRTRSTSGFVLDNETYSDKEIRDIKTAQKDDYISLKDLKPDGAIG
jgi:hypothetical protein